MPHVSVVPAASIEGEPFAKVSVLLNGVWTVQMIIDTGATRTTITPRVQQRLGLGTRPSWALVASGGRVLAPRASLASLELLGVPETRVSNLAVRVMNLPFAEGVLGIDYLSRFIEVCYDFRTSTLRLTRDDMAAGLGPLT